MGLGVGDIFSSPRTIPAGSPFVSGSAANGLSVDPVTGKIVLGQDVLAAGDPGKLLNNRELPMNGKSISFTSDAVSSNNPTLIIDNFVRLNYTRNNPSNISDMIAASMFSIGTKSGLGGVSMVSSWGPAVGDGLEVGYNNSLIFTAGRPDGGWINNQGTLPDLYVNAQGMLQLSAGGGVPTSSDSYLQLTQNPFLGGLTAGSLAKGVGLQLHYQPFNNTYSLGDVLSVTDGSYIDVYDSSGNSTITLYAGSVSNGTMVQIDDFNKTVLIGNNTNDMMVSINGNNGFTGTVAPVNSITVVGGIVTNVI